MASKPLRASVNVPVWAAGILNQMALDYERPDVPTLQWRVSSKPDRIWSSGTTYSSATLGSDGTRTWQADRIVVTAGTSGMDQLHVLLHEAAHWIAGHQHSHSATFYNVAFQVYQRYKVPMWYMYERESAYKQVASRIGLRYMPENDRLMWKWAAHWSGIRQRCEPYNPQVHNDPSCDTSWNMLFQN